MELTWQNILMQAIPVLGGALAALLGALPGYFKDKRELAVKERLATEERKTAQEESRQAKAYEERKSAYTDFLIALENANANSTSVDWSYMYKLSEKFGVLRLFCSEPVFAKAEVCVNTMRIFLIETRKTKQHPYDEFAAYWNAHHELVSAMRLDLGVHQTELC